MAKASELTVVVHLNIDLNGEPVTHVLNMPASLQESANGLHVFLDINSRALAKALLPDILALIRQEQQVRGTSK